MSECVFCKIVLKEASASIVYEDEKVIAFMSNRPVNIGHTLVIPKKHYDNIFSIPEDEAAYLFKIVTLIARAVKRATNDEGLKIVQNNGEVAGQVVFHLHIHVIPMESRGKFHHHNDYRATELLETDAEKVRRELPFLSNNKMQL
jgi:histidine triad (HIT) family protein